MSWINENGPLKDVVLSSRIRLARNLADVPFPVLLDEQNAGRVFESIRASISKGKYTLLNNLKFFKISDIDVLDRQIMVEKHLASSDLMQRPEISALLLDSTERISIMINEEDHIRMQCILPGFQLDKAWDYLDTVDDCFETYLPYAFDEQLGYLTSCPTNIGTGLRASIMVHLPALAMTNNLSSILQTISKIGLTTRGLYGEGSEALGHIYQISNQVTLGPSENEIISSLKIVARQIIEKEKQAREAIYKADKAQFEDNIWRAYGILSYARKLDLKEFMTMISQVRVGVNLGIIEKPGLERLDALIISSQAGSIQKASGGDLTPEGINIYRAEIVRKALLEAVN